MPDRLLQRRIMLADGKELKTVSEALALIEERFKDTGCAALDRVRALVVAATATGKRADIKMATEEIRSVLRQADLL
jgi:hypothetical protein